VMLDFDLAKAYGVETALSWDAIMAPQVGAATGTRHSPSQN
jgi:hypothetical protein